MLSKDDSDFHVPNVNLAQFMIENMGKYGDAIALVSRLQHQQQQQLLLLLLLLLLPLLLLPVLIKSSYQNGDRSFVVKLHNVEKIKTADRNTLLSVFVVASGFHTRP